MRPVLFIAGYFGLVFFGGSLLAPWLYAGTQWAAENWHGLEKLASIPFHRIVSRSFIILALLGLWPLLKETGIHSMPDAGVPSPRPWLRLWGWGLFAGCSLAAAACLTVSCGARSWNYSIPAIQFANRIVSAAATGLGVSLLEEFLFRGVLYGALRRSMRWPAALLWSSVIYAILHFFRRVESPPQVDWLSGLRLLPSMLGGFAEWNLLIPGFLTLTILGAILALAYERTGNLYFSMGMHASLVFWLKLYGFITIPSPNGESPFWGTSKMIDGWLSLIIVSALGLICCLRLKPAKSTPS